MEFLQIEKPVYVSKAPTKGIELESKTKFTEKNCEKICLLLAEGFSLRKICERHEELPSIGTVSYWIHCNDPKGKYTSFRRDYWLARQSQTFGFADEIIEIADAVEGEESNAAVQAARVRIQARQWVLQKLHRLTFGDRQEAKNNERDLGTDQTPVLFLPAEDAQWEAKHGSKIVDKFEKEEKKGPKLLSFSLLKATEVSTEITENTEITEEEVKDGT